MGTLTAPTQMLRREAVAALVALIPEGPSETLVLTLTGDEVPTTSYMDELVRRLLALNHVGSLVLRNADEYVRDLACWAAETYGVSDRIRFD